MWSVDLASLDLERDKDYIIKQVLDHGSTQATDWLRGVYSAEEIATAIKKTSSSAWSRKSLALWSLIFGATPAKQGRFA